MRSALQLCLSFLSAGRHRINYFLYNKTIKKILLYPKNIEGKIKGG
jgi:hypothetical protein